MRTTDYFGVFFGALAVTGASARNNDLCEIGPPTTTPCSRTNLVTCAEVKYDGVANRVGFISYELSGYSSNPSGATR